MYTCICLSLVMLSLLCMVSLLVVARNTKTAGMIWLVRAWPDGMQLAGQNMRVLLVCHCICCCWQVVGGFLSRCLATVAQLHLCAQCA